MSHEIHRVVAFEIVGPYTLKVRFDDATEQVINFEPVLFGEMFRPLRDLQLFNQVRLDAEVHTLVWPNGADFDPATLHEIGRSSATKSSLGLACGNWRPLVVNSCN